MKIRLTQHFVIRLPSLFTDLSEKLTERHDFCHGVELEAFVAWIQNDLSGHLDICAANMETLARRWVAKGALDLNRPTLFRAKFNHEVDLRPCGSSIEGRPRCGWQRVEDGFD